MVLSRETIYKITQNVAWSQTESSQEKPEKIAGSSQIWASIHTKGNRTLDTDRESPMIHSKQGFTLYELLVTLALVTILVGAAVPAFGIYLAKSRQTVEINALFHAVHRARKASIMRRKVVSICPTPDGLQCGVMTDWSTGWLLFENTDADSPPQVDDGEPILARHPVDAAVGIVANRRGFTLRATVKRATNGTLVVCDRTGRAAPRALVISYTGRPRMARERPDGTPYVCPHYVHQ